MERRVFLKSGSLAASSLLLPLPLMAKEGKIKLAFLGTGWWGTEMLLPNALSTDQFEIVGLCDVDSNALNRAAGGIVEAGHARPQLFSSHKKMYEMPGLQAVAIATPTYWHPLQFIDACDKGLHVFLEKPISYDIREGQAMLEAQQRAKNVVQVDFPRIMVDTNGQVKAYIDSGEAGRILQVQANINSNLGPLVEKEIPETLDFETYCGPAPTKKYLCNRNSSKPNWRGQHDFSRGIMADWGIHYIHNIRRVLGLGLPDQVSAIGGNTKNLSMDHPDHLDVRFEFGGLPVYWSHKTWGFVSPLPDNNIGVYYFGEKATIFAGDLGWEVYTKNGSDKIVHGDIRFRSGDPDFMAVANKMIQGLFSEFADGIVSNSNQGISNPLDDAQLTTSSVIYGDMAYRVKSSLTVNQSTMDVENNAEAQALLKREYRKPYQHPYSG